MRRLRNEYRVALVTGAGRGLGRQLALDLLSEGVAVAAIDQCADNLASLRDECSASQSALAWAAADVADATALEYQVRELERQLGAVDLLIANAGVGYETSAVSIHGGDVASMLQINLIGAWNSINIVRTGMLDRRKGHLVAISSLASFRGLPRMVGYCASKAGVNSLMDGLRVELSAFGVHTTTICPGYIRTAMVADNTMPMPYLMEVQDASKAILWAILRKKAFYAFPWRLAWRMRLLTMLPRSWQDRLLRWLIPIETGRPC